MATVTPASADGLNDGSIVIKDYNTSEEIFRRDSDRRVACYVEYDPDAVPGAKSEAGIAPKW